MRRILRAENRASSRHVLGFVSGPGDGCAGTELLMATDGGRIHADARPTLAGRRVRLRPGQPDDAQRLRAILAEPSVSRWWSELDPVTVIEEDLRAAAHRCFWW